MRKLVFAAALAALAAPAVAAPPADRPQIVGRWIVTRSADRFADATTVIAMTVEGNGVLAVRCRARELSVALGDNSARFPSGKPVRLRFRADGGAVADAMGLALTERMVELDGDVAGIAKQVRDARTVAFRANDGLSERDFVFSDLTGAGKAVAPVIKECAAD